MKKSIKEILQETFEEKHGEWKYYSGSDFPKDIPLYSEVESRTFIKLFIKFSGKESFKFTKLIDKLGDRAIHVVSAFLLGHYIYNNTIFKNRIDDIINNLKESLGLQSNVTFSFMWFLTCLFHDIGFNMEINEFKYCTFENFENSNRKMPKISGVPILYEKVYPKYFKYRIKEHCKNDHGIMMGHIMYHELCRLRRYFEKTEKSAHLSWEKNLENIYAYCAWNILAHNIWYCNKDKACDEEIYENYGLQDLILGKDEDKYKIKFEEHPFFFLFCLVDTIEPYKRVLDFDSLDKVYLELDNETIRISTDLKCNCGKEIIKQANSLNDWLTQVTKDENVVNISIINKK